MRPHQPTPQVSTTAANKDVMAAIAAAMAAEEQATAGEAMQQRQQAVQAAAAAAAQQQPLQQAAAAAPADPFAAAATQTQPAAQQPAAQQAVAADPADPFAQTGDQAREHPSKDELDAMPQGSLEIRLKKRLKQSILVNLCLLSLPLFAAAGAFVWYKADEQNQLAAQEFLGNIKMVAKGEDIADRNKAIQEKYGHLQDEEDKAADAARTAPKAAEPKASKPNDAKGETLVIPSVPVSTKRTR